MLKRTVSSRIRKKQCLIIRTRNKRPAVIGNVTDCLNVVQVAHPKCTLSEEVCYGYNLLKSPEVERLLICPNESWLYVYSDVPIIERFQLKFIALNSPVFMREREREREREFDSMLA